MADLLTRMFSGVISRVTQNDGEIERAEIHGKCGGVVTFRVGGSVESKEVKFFSFPENKNERVIVRDGDHRHTALSDAQVGDIVNKVVGG